jgi:phage terminase large subunit-like protein
VHVGKKLRAEPVAAMYEQGRVHHVGEFPVLEDQMTIWTPNDPDSPDRIDAMVQAFSDLLGVSSISNYFQFNSKLLHSMRIANAKVNDPLQ